MNTHRPELEETFRMLADEELLRRCGSGDLTELAQSVADAEVRSRGLAPPPPVAAAPQPVYHGDMCVVVRHLTPTEAYLLKSCLEAAGVPADVGDVNLVQVNALLSVAVGGSSLRVPEAFVTQATEVIAAYRRGDFALDENFDETNPDL